MTILNAYTHLRTALQPLYDERECANISDWVIEYLTGYKKSERLVHKNDILTATQIAAYQQYCDVLLQYMPVQYVLQQAWFAGMPLYVNEHVLIPRPETEELVEWIAQTIAASSSILDIGTGSGCIPIALKKQLPTACIEAVDISNEVLQVAAKNANQFNTDIRFTQIDILDESKWDSMPLYNCIISNPPYIRQSEQTEMHNNVMLHEPHLALFVPDNDPLLFYRKIALFAQQHLTNGGALYFEINESLSNEMVTLLTSLHYSEIIVRKDLQGKDRMIKACKI